MQASNAVFYRYWIKIFTSTIILNSFFLLSIDPEIRVETNEMLCTLQCNEWKDENIGNEWNVISKSRVSILLGWDSKLKLSLPHKSIPQTPCTNPVQKHPKCIIVNTSKIHCHSRSAHDALSCSICLYIVAADFCTSIGRQWKSGKSIGALNKPRITWTINWQADKTETVAMERHEFQNPSTGLRKHPTKWNEFKYTTASKQQRTCWKSY